MWKVGENRFLTSDQPADEPRTSITRCDHRLTHSFQPVVNADVLHNFWFVLFEPVSDGSDSSLNGQINAVFAGNIVRLASSGTKDFLGDIGFRRVVNRNGGFQFIGINFDTKDTIIRGLSIIAQHADILAGQFHELLTKRGILLVHLHKLIDRLNGG